MAICAHNQPITIGRRQSSAEDVHACAGVHSGASCRELSVFAPIPTIICIDLSQMHAYLR